MKNRSHIPFSPAKFPFFYGWVTVFAGTIGMLVSIPGQTMGISVFTDYLISSLGLSRDILTTAYMIGTAGSSLVLTFAGKLYDRYGARLVAIGSAIGLASALVLASFSPTLVTKAVNITHFSSRTIAFVIITVAFFAIRFTGQGVMTMASRNFMMKWFDQRRGLANMISSFFVSMGFSIAPLLLSGLIDEFNWNGAWQILGLISLCFAVFVFVFYRDNPEECGLIPDGKIIPSRKTNKSNFISRQQYTLKQAQRTWSLWIFSFVFAFYSFFISGFTFNVISLFETYNYSTDKALAIFIPTSIISVVASTLGNIYSDYIRLQYLLFVMIGGGILSTTGLIFLGTDIGYYIFIIGNGIMGGMFTVLISVTWPRFYGRKHLGAISGFSSSIIVMASSLGPLYFSRILTLTGSYTLAGILGFVFISLLLVAATKAKNPQ